MSLSAFFKGHQKQEAVLDYVASNRFLNEEEKPEVWKLKAITSRKEAAIKKMCLMRDKKGTELDADRFLTLLTVESVVYPNLNDKDLQDSYGVMGAESLLLEMLLPGELTKLKMKAQEINGYTDSMDNMVEDAKN